MTDTTNPTAGDAVAETARSFDPGTNVLVVDESGGEALPFSLRHTAADEGVAVVTTDHSAPSVADAARRSLADSARLDIVDCTGKSTGVDTPVVDSLVSAGQDLPSVGEATVDTVQSGDSTALSTVHLGSMSTLVARSTVQQVYKLLYMVADQVRANGLVAFYAWDGPSDAKTLRILGQALDRRVSLEGRGEPTVRSSTEWSGDDG
jgi:hypothetical protein